jgi:hypothetical protein
MDTIRPAAIKSTDIEVLYSSARRSVIPKDELKPFNTETYFQFITHFLKIFYNNIK